MHYPAPQKEAKILDWLHAFQAIFTLIAFILGIARIAYYGGPRSRMDVWIVTVVSDPHTA